MRLAYHHCSHNQNHSIYSDYNLLLANLCIPNCCPASCVFIHFLFPSFFSAFAFQFLFTLRNQLRQIKLTSRYGNFLSVAVPTMGINWVKPILFESLMVDEAETAAGVCNASVKVKEIALQKCMHAVYAS